MKALKWQLLSLMQSKLSVHTKFYNFSRKFWQGVALSWTFLGPQGPEISLGAAVPPRPHPPPPLEPPLIPRIYALGCVRVCERRPGTASTLRPAWRYPTTGSTWWSGIWWTSPTTSRPTTGRQTRCSTTTNWWRLCMRTSSSDTSWSRCWHRPYWRSTTRRNSNLTVLLGTGTWIIDVRSSNCMNFIFILNFMNF